MQRPVNGYLATRLEPRLHQQLVALGVEGLESMYQGPAGLFPFTARRGAHGLECDGASIRYSAMALVGLRATARAGVQIRLDLDTLERSLVQRLDHVANIGDVGLIAWAQAQGTASHAETALARIEAHGEFFRTAGSGLFASMELAWLLLGLLALWPKHVYRARIEPLIHRAYLDLAANHSSTSGFMRFARQASGVASPFKRDLCFFAEQIYGIQAFAAYGAWANERDAFDRARRLARLVCRFQGPRGQWAWAYHAGSGRLIDRYPVYSVHQHGMAPMGLGRLAAVTGDDFSAPVLRGFRWVVGDNELGRSMIDGEIPVVWRSIRRHGPWRALAKVHKAAILCGAPLLRSFAEHSPGLAVDQECRPYELGWMLVALHERWT